MKIEIPMPKMGESIMEGTILKWHKKPGELIKKDEILFEISTDKVDSEIPSPVAGKLLEITAQEGETLEVGKTVAYLDTDSNSLNEIIESKEEISSSKKEVIEKAKTIPSQVTQQTIDVPMPKMGESVMEGTIIKWHKKPGDAVKHDELLFEISTDKVDTEVPSPVNGTLAEILVAEQQTVEVGVVVARIFTSEHVHQAEVVHETVHEDHQMHSVIGENILSHFKSESELKEDNRFYSPLVMNIAKKEKVSVAELAEIHGSGLGGRVTKNDILAYINKRGAQTKISSQTTELHFDGELYEANRIEKIPMDQIRQKIMQHMIKSRDTSVHVAATLDVDITKVHQFINAKKDYYQSAKGIKLTYLAFIADAVVKALKAFPVVNSTIDGNTILQKRYINLGIAVALEPNGLIVPNIKNAHTKSVVQFAESIVDVAQRARLKKLTPDDVSNGTFSITNYGVFGTVIGTPIINQPEVAILGVGAVSKKPVVIEVEGNDVIAIRHIMTLALSHDHRLVDGMVGGKFLSTIKMILENFDEKKVL